MFTGNGHLVADLMALRSIYPSSNKRNVNYGDGKDPVI